jgi:hypothetical protein
VPLWQRRGNFTTNCVKSNFLRIFLFLLGPI